MFGWRLTDVPGFDDCPCYEMSTNERTAQGKGTPRKQHFVANVPRLQALLDVIQPLIELCSSDTALQSTLDSCSESIVLSSCVNARAVLARRKDSGALVLLTSPGCHIANVTFSSFFLGSRVLMAQQYQLVLQSAAALVGLTFSSDHGDLQDLAKLTRYQSSKAWNWQV
jgi:hypothetical protein